MKTPLTRFQLAMEILSAALLAGMFLLILFRWGALPARIPSHFNALGKVDGWSAKGFVFFLPAVGAGLCALLTAVSRFPQAWNLPVGVTAQTAPAVYRRTKDMVVLLKAEVEAAFFSILFFTVQVRPLPAAFLFVWLGALAVTLILCISRIVRAG